MLFVQLLALRVVAPALQPALAAAQSAVTRLAAVSLTNGGRTLDALNLALDAELAGSTQPEQRWVWHIDDHSIVIALLSADTATGVEEAVLSLAHRPAGRETAYATLGGGAYIQLDDADAVEATAGDASACANVLTLPSGWCSQLDRFVEHLETTGTGMPLELVRKPAASLQSACDGLLDVVLGRADVHLAPPARYLLPQLTPPPQVLCAFELLLEECGGCLSDVYGDSLVVPHPIASWAAGDVVGGGVRAEGVVAASGDAVGGEADGAASSTPDGMPGGMSDAQGVLACHEACHNYFVRSGVAAFPRPRRSSTMDGIPIDLRGLSETMRGIDAVDDASEG
mmetsp:Transcript_45156/g.101972  ORF Transcript_45156/g.101972 Transcript_45156/m.101972 type:complete len:341 (-) Transcript_45156:221-1243(-)